MTTKTTKRTWTSFRLILLPGLLLTFVPAHAQTLADLAKKEKDRRQGIQTDSKVITNHDTSRYRNGALTTANRPRPVVVEDSRPEEDAKGEMEKAVDPDEPVDFSGRTESFWRQSMADARGAVKELENHATALILKLNDLQNRFYREDNGFEQQAIQREIQKTFYEQDLTKEKLEEAQDQLNDLLKEARKSGALPGWLQPRGD